MAAEKCTPLAEINLPTKHKVITCQQKAKNTLHFKRFDAAHDVIDIRKRGQYRQVQLNFTGDWMVTPTKIQLVPYYLDQLRKYNGKLIFEDDYRATYKYYHQGRSIWLEVHFVGDGIHILKSISQLGIVRDAQYNLAQIKSRMKRYGKVVFSGLELNPAAMDKVFESEDFKLLKTYLYAHKGQKYYLTCHIQAENAYVISQHICTAFAEKFLDWGDDFDHNIHVLGVGAASPLINPKKQNAVQKNNRIELVFRMND